MGWQERISNKALQSALAEMERGLVDADLGGHVFKKRVAIGSRGKSCGVRTLLAYRIGNKAFFVYGFAKNARSNISNHDQMALRALAKKLLAYSEQVLAILVATGKLIEVKDNE